MITYVVTVWAKPGHETDVTKFYQSLEPLLKEAPGYGGRQILRARAGTMAEAVRKVVPAAELARHAEPPAPNGTHFVIIEHWDRVDQRIAFSRGAAAARARELMPHLLPDHTHEFYDEVRVT
jgi:hypothetical protein